MAPRLGAPLIRCAMGPVNYAGSLIMAKRVPDGIRELTPESLHGGLKRGVAEAAKLASVPAADVESLLPQSEIRAAVESLGKSQRAAIAAWNVHAGQIGGLLEGVADLTVDGRVPDVPLCIERLAQKVSRDAAFAEPLNALAQDVARWQDLVNECRRIVDDGPSLAKAYQRQRIRKIGTAVVLGLAFGVGLFVFWRIRAAHALVEAKLASAEHDACAVLDLTADELAGGSSGQKERAEASKKTCTEKREREQKERAERERKEVEARAAAKKKSEREAACKQLAEHVAAGSLSDGDSAIAGDAADLLGRVAKKELEAKDLGPEDPALPCSETGFSAKLSDAYGAAVLAARWVESDDLSDKACDVLANHGEALRPFQKGLLLLRAEAIAKRAIVAGETSLVSRASRLCTLTDKLGQPGRAFCPGALALAKKK